jgi:hypothetical protein
MPKLVLLDNDAALKTACYSLVEEMLAVITKDGAVPLLLGVGRFVIRARLARADNIADRERAIEAFDRFLQDATLVEPDDAELAMAAEFEADAGRRNVELDGGESQLLAILIKRSAQLLITGDKRAIVAMAAIDLRAVAGKIACLEQLFAQIVRLAGEPLVRRHVCAEPQIDRALTICCGCSGGSSPDGGILEGLTSYIAALRRSAPGILADDAAPTCLSA